MSISQSTLDELYDRWTSLVDSDVVPTELPSELFLDVGKRVAEWREVIAERRADLDLILEERKVELLSLKKSIEETEKKMRREVWDRVKRHKRSREISSLFEFLVAVLTVYHDIGVRASTSNFDFALKNRTALLETHSLDERRLLFQVLVDRTEPSLRKFEAAREEMLNARTRYLEELANWDVDSEIRALKSGKNSRKKKEEGSAWTLQRYGRAQARPKKLAAGAAKRLRRLETAYDSMKQRLLRALSVEGSHIENAVLQDIRDSFEKLAAGPASAETRARLDATVRDLNAVREEIQHFNDGYADSLDRLEESLRDARELYRAAERDTRTLLAALRNLKNPKSATQTKKKKQRRRQSLTAVPDFRQKENFLELLNDFLAGLEDGGESYRMGAADLTQEGLCSKIKRARQQRDSSGGGGDGGGGRCVNETLQPYQRLAPLIMSGDSKQGVLMMAEVGVGKTATGVEFIRRTVGEFLSADFDDAADGRPFRDGEFDVLVLVPNSNLFQVWELELDKFYCEFRSQLSNKMRNYASVAKNREFRVYHQQEDAGGGRGGRYMRLILHSMEFVLQQEYRSVWRKFQVAGDWTDPRKSPNFEYRADPEYDAAAREGSRQSFFVNEESVRRDYVMPNRVIVDEVHNLVNPKTFGTSLAREKAIKFAMYIRMASNVRVLAMTATPLREADRMQDLFKLLNMVAGPEFALPNSEFPAGAWLRYPTKAEQERGAWDALEGLRDAEHEEVMDAMFSDQKAGTWREGAKERLQLLTTGFVSYATLKFDPRVYPSMALPQLEGSRPEEHVFDFRGGGTPARWSRESPLPLAAHEASANRSRAYGYVRPTLHIVVPKRSDWKQFVGAASARANRGKTGIADSRHGSYKGSLYKRSVPPKVAALKMSIDDLTEKGSGKHFCYASGDVKTYHYWLTAVAQAFGGWRRRGNRPNAEWENYSNPDALNSVEGPRYAVMDAVTVGRWLRDGDHWRERWPSGGQEQPGVRTAGRARAGCRFALASTWQSVLDAWFEEHGAEERVLLFTDDSSKTAMINAGVFGNTAYHFDACRDRLNLTKQFMAQLFSDPRNAQGSFVRAMFVDQTGKEGLNTKAVTHVHAITLLEDENEQKQVAGRAMRMCSHADLMDVAQGNPSVELVMYPFANSTTFPDEQDDQEGDDEDAILGREGPGGCPECDELTNFYVRVRRVKANRLVEQNIREGAIDCELTGEYMSDPAAGLVCRGKVLLAPAAPPSFPSSSSSLPGEKKNKKTQRAKVRGENDEMCLVLDERGVLTKLYDAEELQQRLMDIGRSPDQAAAAVAVVPPGDLCRSLGGYLSNSPRYNLREARVRFWLQRLLQETNRSDAQEGEQEDNPEEEEEEEVGSQSKSWMQTFQNWWRPRKSQEEQKRSPSHMTSDGDGESIHIPPKFLERVAREIGVSAEEIERFVQQTTSSDAPQEALEFLDRYFLKILREHKQLSPDYSDSRALIPLHDLEHMSEPKARALLRILDARREAVGEPEFRDRLENQARIDVNLFFALLDIQQKKQQILDLLQNAPQHSHGVHVMNPRHYFALRNPARLERVPKGQRLPTLTTLANEQEQDLLPEESDSDSEPESEFERDTTSTEPYPAEEEEEPGTEGKYDNYRERAGGEGKYDQPTDLAWSSSDEDEQEQEQEQEEKYYGQAEAEEEEEDTDISDDDNVDPDYNEDAWENLKDDSDWESEQE